MRVLLRPRVWLSLVLAVGVLLAAVPQTRWRIHVIALHLLGEIPDLELGELLTFMLPGSDQTMTFLITKRNPYAVFENARTSQADILAGALLYRDHCMACHGPDGTGGSTAPALTSGKFKYGDSDWALYRAIRLGVPNTAMLPAKALSITQRWQVISYVRSLAVPQDAAAAAPARRAPNAPYEDLVSHKNAGEDWLTFSGVYSSIRHSALAQVNRSNVDHLAVRWIRQLQHTEGVQVTPLVNDGIMYVSLPGCFVYALDAYTGAELWSYRCRLVNTSPSDVGGANTRGVALLDDKVFVATWDARLIALSAATGKELWQTVVADDYDVYFISSAPLAFRNLVVTGVGTRRVGRGFVAAFDASTGREVWRFFAIPGEGEAGNDTWEGDSWKVGGGPTWLTGSYDAEADLLYWGVGNPKPDYDTATREGDNLYTNSVVALRGTSGELAWHFQFSPGNDKDWDSAQIPVLIDHPSPDGTSKLLLWANRNGFYYVLDRITGRFLMGTPFVQQNWAEGLDSKGRPIEVDRDRGVNGELLYPGNVGGTNWWPPTYYPERDLMIVPVLEQGMVYFSSYQSPPRANGRPFYTAIRALDATTGRVVWDHQHEPRFAENRIYGVASTKGGLVFGSDLTRFYALDAEDGRELWSIETGGKIVAPPMTYAARGEQFVVITAGGDLLAFALPKSPQ